MTKEKIFETSFSLIKDTIGNDVFEYADNSTIVLATLAHIVGIVRNTENLLEDLIDKEFPTRI